jgi:hypothetical protein
MPVALRFKRRLERRTLRLELHLVRRLARLQSLRAACLRLAPRLLHLAPRLLLVAPLITPCLLHLLLLLLAHQEKNNGCSFAGGSGRI